MMTADDRFAALNLMLPPAPKPVAVYKSAIRAGDLLFLSGHGPLKSDGTLMLGTCGQDLTLEGGYDAAKQTGLAILATLKAQLGSLNKVKRLVKSLGMVQCLPTFKDHPKVINGYSDLMKAVFGDDAGVGARSAVGMIALPGNMAVEIEAIFEVG
jgi:enamine deaminase RidA (YjgF/YER057c/UK114 family)